MTHDHENEGVLGGEYTSGDKVIRWRTEYTSGDTVIRWRTEQSPEGAGRRQDTLEIGDVRLIITRDPFGKAAVTTSVDSEGLMRDDLPDGHPWNAGARALLATVLSLVHNQIVRTSDEAFHDSLLMAMDRLRLQNMAREALQRDEATLVVPKSALRHVASTQHLSEDQLDELVGKIQYVFSTAKIGSGRPGDLLGQLLESVIEECVAEMDADNSPAP